jgi:hypothetical protein
VWAIAVVVVQLVSVLVIFLLVAGNRLTTTSTVVGSAADVVGFWPVTCHPLAGASYREPVLEGIRAELNAAAAADRHVVLAGHSQGSVLCAWTLRHTSRFDHVALVTCGSPLRSLYAEFFPDFFDDAFFTRLRGRPAPWVNLWRDTDPIATPMPGLPDELDVRIEDPPPGGALKAHGDYWIAPEQIAAVTRLLDPARTES